MGGFVALRHAALLGGEDAVIAISTPATWGISHRLRGRALILAAQNRIGRRILSSRGTRVGDRLPGHAALAIRPGGPDQHSRCADPWRPRPVRTDQRRPVAARAPRRTEAPDHAAPDSGMQRRPTPPTSPHASARWSTRCSTKRVNQRARRTMPAVSKPRRPRADGTSRIEPWAPRDNGARRCTRPARPLQGPCDCPPGRRCRSVGCRTTAVRPARSGRRGGCRGPSRAARTLGSALLTSRADGGRLQVAPPIGYAWWALCHDSPNESSASAATFLLPSCVSNGRRPNTWQTELTPQVTWCRTATRMRPAHISVTNPAAIVPPSAQPSPNGTASEATHHSGNSRSIIARSRSRRMSAANLAVRVGGWVNSHPVWACHRPAAPPLRRRSGGVRRMGVAVPVGVGVVTAVVGDPTDRAALKGHGPGDGEGDLQGPATP